MQKMQERGRAVRAANAESEVHVPLSNELLAFRDKMIAEVDSKPGIHDADLLEEIEDEAKSDSEDQKDDEEISLKEIGGEEKVLVSVEVDGDCIESLEVESTIHASEASLTPRESSTSLSETCETESTVEEKLPMNLKRGTAWASEETVDESKVDLVEGDSDDEEEEISVITTAGFSQQSHYNERGPRNAWAM